MTLAILDVSSKKGAYREISHITLKHTQYATSLYQKHQHRRKGGKVMTAINMCSNFGGFRLSTPKKNNGGCCVSNARRSTQRES